MSENKKVARRSVAGRSAARRAEPASGADLRRLKLLFTVVDRKKAELFADLISAYEVNMQLMLAAEGTAPTEALRVLGLADAEKAVIISVIPVDRAKGLLDMLEEKFRTVRGGKGIAYTVPISGTIGVAIYQFLSNRK